jgi:hypothetical protein
MNEKLTIIELKKVLAVFIELLETSNIHEIEYKQDWYWKVCDTQIFDFEHIPNESGIVVGSIYDSIQRAKRIIADENIVFTDIDDIATLIKATYIALTD